MNTLRNALLAIAIGLSMTACGDPGDYNPYANAALMNLGSALLLQSIQPAYQPPPMHCQAFQQGFFTTMNCQ